jgi:hypothetical protein
LTRTRLPNRRLAETIEVEHGGARFEMTIGFYPDGQPGEVFTHGAFKGAALDALLADACVLVSHLIQHGAKLHDLARSMGRLSNAGPASIIGAVIDTAAKAHPVESLEESLLFNDPSYCPELIGIQDMPART